jgi:hypothetical protein
MKHLASLAMLSVAGALPSRAALTDNLISYYNFEESGTAGLTNMIPGAGNHPGSYGNADMIGAIPSFGAGAGFAGSATFEGAESGAATDRSLLLAGKALNIAKSDASATAGSGWFTVNSLTGSSLAPNFTVSGWFFLAPDADNGGTTADILRDFVFEANSNFDVSFGTGSAAGLTYTSYVGQTIHSTTGDLAAGQWHHVAHVFSVNGTNTDLRVYVNGTQVGGVVSAPTANMDFIGLNFGANRGGARVFDGMLDEVAVWNRALTPAEVTELRNLGLAGTPLVDSVLVSLSASPGTSGTTTGTGTYTRGVEVNVTATANPGYVFSGWEGSFDGQPASFTYTANTGAVSTAVFAQDTTDSDGDGLTHYEEVVIYQTLPNNPDTDGDEIPDGDEVDITGTSPLTSDALLVDFVRQNLSPDTAGAIALSPPRIERDPGTGAISLFLSLSGSADQAVWQDIDLSHPSVSIVPAGDGWNVTFPAPSNTVDSYILLGSRP